MKECKQICLSYQYTNPLSQCLKFLTKSQQRATSAFSSWPCGTFTWVQTYNRSSVSSQTLRFRYLQTQLHQRELEDPFIDKGMLTIEFNNLTLSVNLDIQKLLCCNLTIVSYTWNFFANLLLLLVFYFSKIYKMVITPVGQNQRENIQGSTSAGTNGGPGRTRYNPAPQRTYRERYRPCTPVLADFPDIYFSSSQ